MDQMEPLYVYSSLPYPKTYEKLTQQNMVCLRQIPYVVSTGDQSVQCKWYSLTDGWLALGMKTMKDSLNLMSVGLGSNSNWLTLLWIPCLVKQSYLKHIKYM